MASWGPLGPSWGLLEAEGSKFPSVTPVWAPSWSRLGGLLGRLGGLLGRLGALLGRLGARRNRGGNHILEMGQNMLPAKAPVRFSAKIDPPKIALRLPC